MGLTPIPLVRPQEPSADELFRRSISPPPDRLGWALSTGLSLLIVLMIAAAVIAALVAR